MLMLRYGMGAEQASALLSRWSQERNIKVRTLPKRWFKPGMQDFMGHKFFNTTMACYEVTGKRPAADRVSDSWTAPYG